MKTLHLCLLPFLLALFCTLPESALCQMVGGERVTKDLPSWEISGALGIAPNFNPPSHRYSTPTGFMVEAAYRPSSLSDQMLLGIYGFNLPGKNLFEPQPTIRGVGARVSWQVQNRSQIFKPYLSFASGWYEVDVPPPPTLCGVVPPCFPVRSDYSQLETLSLAPGAGFNISVSPELVLKADAGLHIPLHKAPYGKSDHPRLITSLGMTFRLW